MIDITQRQQAVLAFIRKHQRVAGMPPTRADIAHEFGFNPNAAQGHLKALEAKGLIELVPGSSRNIRLLDDDDTESALGKFMLPLVGRIAAGSPITAEENVEEQLVVDPRLFHPRADFLHRVSGHSMKDAGILDGDIVAIHQQPVADNGQIIAAALLVARTGDELITLKRYARRGNKIVLKAENSAPGYAPIEIDLADAQEEDDRAQFRVAGIFAGLIRLA